MNFSSKYLENAIDVFSTLPGVGRKTAFRFVVHLLKQDRRDLISFTNALEQLMQHSKNCVHCHNISEQEVCNICSSPHRNRHLLMVVEDIRDMMAIESTGQFNGLYHLLGGVISPMDGIGPNDINSATLIKRVGEGDFQEIILALRTTVEGDTTSFYLYKKLKREGLIITTIARGVSVGGELEYADELTLGRSIMHRLNYETTLAR